MKKRVYVTDNGTELEIRAISLSELQMAQAGLRAEYVERGEPLNPPKYKIETFGGGEEWHDHDEKSIRTDEEKEAWAKYLDANNRLNRESAKLVQEFVFEDGIVLDVPENGTWQARMKRRRIKIPDDLTEMRTLYILTEYLKTPQDIKSCIGEILKVSARGTDNQAEIEAALKSFLGPVEAE